VGGRERRAKEGQLCEHVATASTWARLWPVDSGVVVEELALHWLASSSMPRLTMGDGKRPTHKTSVTLVEKMLEAMVNKRRRIKKSNCRKIRDLTWKTLQCEG